MKMNSNRLIAEFMGAEGHPKYNPTEWDVYITGCLDVDSDNENAQHFFTPDQMKYHTSWDWLMPVVEKCMQTGDNTDEWDALYDALSTLNKTNIYQAVVEFIKELKYNNMKLKDENFNDVNVEELTLESKCIKFLTDKGYRVEKEEKINFVHWTIKATWNNGDVEYLDNIPQWVAKGVEEHLDNVESEYNKY